MVNVTAHKLVPNIVENFLPFNLLTNPTHTVTMIPPYHCFLEFSTMES